MAVPTVELDKMTVPELKKLAKDRGISGYSRLKRQELIDLHTKAPVTEKPVEKPPVEDRQDSQEPIVCLDDMTVPDLRKLAKERGFSGYSRLKRQELIDLHVKGNLPAPEKPTVDRSSEKPVEKQSLDEMTVPELRKLAKERGITGYSRLKRQELLDLHAKGPAVVTASA